MLSAVFRQENDMPTIVPRVIARKALICNQPRLSLTDGNTNAEDE